ncbi:MAG TPA: methyltransferase domain-containing protein [Acidimicrobiales bacterium]
MTGDAWQPDQYHRFGDERRAPFLDLLGLIRPVTGGRVVDLGCGTGELTALLHEHTQASETVGVDRSPEMLRGAEAWARPGLSFRAGDLGAFEDPGAWDVVAANAALHWVPDHADVLARWTASLRPGGQLAVQVPANVDHPSHRLSAEVATEPEFVGLFGEEGPPPDPVLSVLRPEQYAELLERLGYDEQHVRLQVYGHRLGSTADVVEWVKGTSLTRFRARMEPADYERFVTRYRERLVAELGDHRPYFYAFKRILFWGRLP